MIDPRRHAVLVAAHSGLADRLPEVLEPSGMEVSYIGCPADPLHRSRFVRSSAAVGSHADCGHFVHALVTRPDLLEALPDWVVWGDDMDMLRTARSALPEATKLRILPARSPRGLPIIGSKTAFADLAQKLALPFPRSIVVASPDHLAAAIDAVSAPLLVKGERGGAAYRLVFVDDAGDFDPTIIPAYWYPVLVQEHVPGREVSVEALFGHGRLLGWQYSVPTLVEARFGRTLARRYVEPRSLDFADTLERLAATAGLHGFANCTFIRQHDSDRHLLLETDMRANAWHQFGPRLGVDWGALMLGTGTAEPAHPRIGAGDGIAIHLYPREVVHALRTASWSAARPWLLNAAGTWRTRNARDRAVNAEDRRQVRGAARGAIRSRLPGWVHFRPHRPTRGAPHG